ncbi:MAG TPA: hypothetical protein PLJ84_11080 [Bacteroidales bacterium]|nr:hypothetical protein [Bacteroidales bacterium]HPT03130.1 hypothetical protein [Bacteroidales bacterium]
MGSGHHPKTVTPVAFLIVLTVMLTACPVVKAQKAAAKLDTAAIRIGEQVRLQLGFTAPKSVKVQWPVIPDTLSPSVEVVKRGPVDTSAVKGRDLLQYSQYITITSFDTGFHSIPPLNFIYRKGSDTAGYNSYTDSLMMQVSTVAVDTTLAIRDIKAPMKQRLTFGELLPYILGALAVLALAAVVIYYLWRRKQNKPFIPKIVKPALPAWQTALNELKELSEKKHWQEGRIKLFHSELSDILRRYLEYQHLIPAVEMTTDDILELCSNSPAVSQSTEQLARVLRLADLVKFAKEIPLPPENEQSLKDAILFVDRTKPVVQQETKATTPSDTAMTQQTTE